MKLKTKHNPNKKTFDDRRKDWESRVESIAIEIMGEQTVDGGTINVSVKPFLKQYNLLIANISTQRKGNIT